MATSPLVSIVIPFKGRLELVKKAVNSIFFQVGFDPSRLEIILVEEKNYGETLRHSLKKEFAKIKIFVNQGKEGPGGSRQTGLRKVRGKYIVFLDSDDQLKSNYLSEIFRVLDSDPNLGAVLCLSMPVFASNFNILERIKLYPLMIIRDLSLLCFYKLNHNNLIPSAFYLCQISHMMFRSSTVKKIQFNYDYRYGGEDWDFIIQVLNKKPTRILPKRLLLFRYSKGSSTDMPINRKLKWKSYSLLAKRVPASFKRGVFYKLFLMYIRLFGYKVRDAS